MSFFSIIRSIILVVWSLPKNAVFSLIAKISPGRVVGIFSREDERSYSFLCDALKCQNLLIREVRTTLITNNGWAGFREEASRCDFAILYHSKNRGRINITDVTDSIYDQEVCHLSQTPGKQNVLVVVDDLDSNTPNDKERILNSQPLIREKTRDLILFRKRSTFKEETGEKIMEIISQIDKMGSSNQGIVYLIWSIFIQGVNFVMVLIFKIWSIFIQGVNFVMVPIFKIWSIFIQGVNFVMVPIFKLFILVGQTRILNYGQSNEIQK